MKLIEKVILMNIKHPWMFKDEKRGVYFFTSQSS